MLDYVIFNYSMEASMNKFQSALYRGGCTVITATYVSCYGMPEHTGKDVQDFKSVEGHEDRAESSIFDMLGVSSPVALASGGMLG